MLTSCSRFRSFPFLSASFRPLRFRFLLLSLCFFLSSLFPSPSHSDLSGAASLPSGFLAFPLPLHPVSRVSSLVLSTWLSAGSLSPSQFCSRSRYTGAYLLFSHSVLVPSFPLSFVSFFSGSNYSGSALSFPFFPAFHRIWSFRCLFIRFPQKPVSMLPFQLRYSALLQLLFTDSTVSRHSRYTASDSLGFRLQPFPVVITLGSGYSAWAIHPEN